MTERVPDECASCGRVDDGPRHVVWTGTEMVGQHVVCCAAAGCDVCAATVTESMRG